MSTVIHNFSTPVADRATEHATLEKDKAATEVGERFVDRLASGGALLSVVIPLLNEEENLDDLYRRLKTALARFAPCHEIFFVDDGSRDGSYRKLRKIWRSDPAVTVVRFRRNFGKAAGLAAAFERVSGELVVMMDADLQDQPEEFGKLIAKMDEGYDLVTGWKRRRHDPLHKTLPSKLFNRTVSRYYGLHIHDFNCGLKIMRAEVAADLQIYGDWHRFIPVLAASKGYRVGECAVEHAPRVHGVSKYGAKRLVTGMLDFLGTILATRFFFKPLQFFGMFGLAAFLVGAAVLLFALLKWAFVGSGQGPWVVGFVFLATGVQLLATGLLAEMVSRISSASKRPYEVAEVLEFTRPRDER